MHRHLNLHLFVLEKCALNFKLEKVKFPIQCKVCWVSLLVVNLKIKSLFKKALFALLYTEAKLICLKIYYNNRAASVQSALQPSHSQTK